MNEPIKVGDLVMVIKPKLCGCNDHGGQVFVVASFRLLHNGGVCTNCQKRTFGPDVAVAEWPGVGFIEPRRLKKIPPLSEPESQQDKQEITA